MRLGWTSALAWALVALGPALLEAPVLADEPPGFAFSRKEPRVTPASFTPRTRGSESTTPSVTGSTRDAEPRDEGLSTEAPWSIRGTLGLPNLQH